MDLKDFLSDFFCVLASEIETDFLIHLDERDSMGICTRVDNW
jgi:hypothetical protein